MFNKKTDSLPATLLVLALAAGLSACAGGPRISESPGPIKRYHDDVGRDKLKNAVKKTAMKPVSGFGTSSFSAGHGVQPYFTRKEQLPKKIGLITFYIYDAGQTATTETGNWIYTRTTWVSEQEGNVLANKFLQASIGPLKKSFEQQGMQLLTIQEALDTKEKATYYRQGISLELGKGLVGAIRQMTIALESGSKQMITGADGYRVFDVSAAWDWKRSIELGHGLAEALEVDAVLSVGLGIATDGNITALNHIKWALNGKNPIPKKEGHRYVSQSLGTGYYEGQCYVKADLNLVGKEGGIPFSNDKTREENLEGFDLLMTVLAEATGELMSEAAAKNAK